jgi:hypothetical protein
MTPLMLIHIITQVAKDEKLLSTARDCFYFATKFFEPINLSATHIYHSALELSPLSSIVRKLYYPQRLARFPRVEVGIQNSQGLSISIPPGLGIAATRSPYGNFIAATWSPCGQFIAKWGNKVMEVRNGLTLELVSSLQPITQYEYAKSAPSYSPDGHFLAGATNSGVVIWDIQTGGVVKNIQPLINRHSLAWSLDGQAVCTLGDQQVHIYNTASNMEDYNVRLESHGYQHLWAHNESFRIMTSSWGGEGLVISIFEVGPTLTKIESFSILKGEWSQYITTFSPTTYRISSQSNAVSYQLFIVDIQNSEILLTLAGSFKSDGFSSDGNCFGAFQSGRIHIWNYDGRHYIPWRQFPSPVANGPLIFSPASSSIALPHADGFGLWHLNHSPTAHTRHLSQLEIISHSGTYIASVCYQGKTITITSNSSETLSQYIDTGIKIAGLGHTGNVLLVKGAKQVKAWLLTEEGWVNNVVDNKRASDSDSIWTVQLPPNYHAKFLVEGETGAIGSGKRSSLLVYNATTGEMLEPTQELPHFDGPWYSFTDNLQAKDHRNDSSLQKVPSGIKQKPLQANLAEGWMKDDQQRHLLWLPVEWRVGEYRVEQFPGISTIKFKSRNGKPIIIKLQ